MSSNAAFIELSIDTKNILCKLLFQGGREMAYQQLYEEACNIPVKRQSIS